jgi:HPt (histidine-containing phosphotransfer) domain-containing protein
MHPVADLTYLIHVTANDKRMMCFFIKAFLADAPNCMRDLTEFTQNENWAGVKKAAHTFKGHARYMGLLEIIPLVQRVEDDAANTPAETIIHDVMRIDAVTRAAMEELAGVLNAMERTVAD